MFPLMPSFPLPRSTEDTVAALWLTLASCRDLADEDEAELFAAAMAHLDEVADLARRLPRDERGPWIDGLSEIGQMAEDIYCYLRNEATPLGQDRPSL